MKNISSKILVLALILLIKPAIYSQTTSDAIMMVQKQTCIGVIYENSSFDHYWEGTYLRTNGTIETVKRNSVTSMLAIGLHDKLNLLLGLPYVSTKSTEPNGGYFAGAKGFQDLSIDLKAELINKEMGSGKLAFLVDAGFSFPVSNYLSDYRPYSIGFGANQFTLRGILQYKTNNGIYIRGAVAHLWRGTTEAERDYYYNNGSYYSATMDVPNAWNYNAVVGKWFFDESLQVEVNYAGLNSTSGDDVRPYNAAQPTNKVNWGRVGGLAHYYFKKPSGLGLLVYYQYTVTGRNTGQTSHIGAGVTYFFSV